MGMAWQRFSLSWGWYARDIKNRKEEQASNSQFSNLLFVSMFVWKHLRFDWGDTKKKSAVAVQCSFLCCRVKIYFRLAWIRTTKTFVHVSASKEGYGITSPRGLWHGPKTGDDDEMPRNDLLSTRLWWSATNRPNPYRKNLKSSLTCTQTPSIDIPIVVILLGMEQANGKN